MKTITPSSALSKSVNPVGRPRLYESDAHRQAAYRGRVASRLAQQTAELTEARRLLAAYEEKKSLTPAKR